jgi:hypothetical protein
MTAGVAGATHYAVEQQTSPDMTVKVAVGTAYVFKSDGSNAYVTKLDAVANVTITSNSSGNPRIDAVVIKVDLGATPNKDADNVATLVAVAGTPAASPSAPSDSAIQTAVGSGNAFYRLANVTVANGASSIATANIADTRSGVQLQVLGSYLRRNLSTSKLQFSNDGTNYKDVGSGTAVFECGLEGNLVVGTNIAGLSWIAPFAVTIIKAFAYVGTAPTGAAVLIDVNKNGSTIWATQGNRLTVAISATSGSQTTFDTTALAEGDRLTVDIDQIGSTVTGADLTVAIYMQAA